MSDKRSGRRAMSAMEFAAQLAQDAEYQERRAIFDSDLEDQAREGREAEQPIVRDLNAAGVDVRSVWDLVNTANPYPEALPVLVEHLERGGYPERVMEGVGRALAVAPAVVYWDRLKSLWTRTQNPGELDGVAVALAACATEEHLDDLIRFVSLEDRGQSRLYFIRPILKVGGAEGRSVVEALQNDPALGEEATARLASQEA